MVLSRPAARATDVILSFPAARSAEPLDGRLILVVSPVATPEPRLQVELESPLTSPYIFGQTVDGMKPGVQVALGAASYGWPVERLAALPAGDYTVQAVLNRYETFRRADGTVVRLPPDMGEGQHWNTKPGNLYSRPVMVRLGPGAPPLALSLDQLVPPIAPPPDTPFVKHVRIRTCTTARSSPARIRSTCAAT